MKRPIAVEVLAASVCLAMIVLLYAGEGIALLTATLDKLLRILDKRWSESEMKKRGTRK